MTLDELAELFKNPTNNTLTPVRLPTELPKNYKYKLYPIKKIAELINELKQLDTDDMDRDEKFSVRYLVTTDKQMLLAREGKQDRRVPGHRTIKDRCLAAGNLFFSDDFTTITKINHQSGDFHPPVASLVWPLAILLAMSKSNIDSQFGIELSSVTNNVFKVNDCLIPTVEELETSIPLTILTESKTANTSTDVLIMQKEQAPRFVSDSTNSSPFKRKLSFDDDTAKTSDESLIKKLNSGREKQASAVSNLSAIYSLSTAASSHAASSSSAANTIRPFFSNHPKWRLCDLDATLIPAASSIPSTPK